MKRVEGILCGILEHVSSRDTLTPSCTRIRCAYERSEGRGWGVASTLRGFPSVSRTSSTSSSLLALYPLDVGTLHTMRTSCAVAYSWGNSGGNEGTWNFTDWDVKPTSNVFRQKIFQTSLSQSRSTKREPRCTLTLWAHPNLACFLVFFSFPIMHQRFHWLDSSILSALNLFFFFFNIPLDKLAFGNRVGKNVEKSNK